MLEDFSDCCIFTATPLCPGAACLHNSLRLLPAWFACCCCCHRQKVHQQTCHLIVLLEAAQPYLHCGTFTENGLRLCPAAHRRLHHSEATAVKVILILSVVLQGGASADLQPGRPPRSSPALGAPLHVHGG